MNGHITISSTGGDWEKHNIERTPWTTPLDAVKYSELFPRKGSLAMSLLHSTFPISSNSKKDLKI